MIGPLWGVLATLELLMASAIGWRYLLSPRFRARMHDQWRRSPRRTVAAEVLIHGLFFVLINGVVLVLIFYTGLWLYRGIVVPRLGP